MSLNGLRETPGTPKPDEKYFKRNRTLTKKKHEITAARRKLGISPILQTLRTTLLPSPPPPPRELGGDRAQWRLSKNDEGKISTTGWLAGWLAG